MSLLFHALLFVAGGWMDINPHRTLQVPVERLDVELQVPNVPDDLLPEQSMWPSEPLRLPPRAAARSGVAATAANRGAGARPGISMDEEAMRQVNAQLSRQLLYPPEAIARGLEGQALVLLKLDAAGNAVAARLEASSGHALLDAAAVRAAKTLRALPAVTPREAVLPVRFRLY